MADKPGLSVPQGLANTRREVASGRLPAYSECPIKKIYLASKEKATGKYICHVLWVTGSLFWGNSRFIYRACGGTQAFVLASRCEPLLWTVSASVCVSVLSLPRINGQLVALKVISMNAEEGVPFTAIREGKTRKKRTPEVVLIARRGKTPAKDSVCPLSVWSPVFVDVML